MSMILEDGIVYTDILLYNKKLADMGLDEINTDQWGNFCFEIKNLIAIRESAEEGLAKGKMFIYLTGMNDAYVNIDYIQENIDELWKYKREYENK